MKLRVLDILVFVAVSYGALVIGVYAIQRSLLYHPSSERPTPAAFGLNDMRPVEATTEDGLALTAWYRPASAGRPTVVLFQGNAGHMGHRAHKARPLLDAGLGLLLAAYRGYGGNPGSPTEDGLYADGRAQLRLLESQGVPASTWILFGESLGSGVAVQLAREWAESGTPVAGLILEAPFPSIPVMAQHHYPFLPAYWLVKDRFDSEAKIAGIGAPVLFIHGSADRVVPQRFGRQLYAAAVDPKKALWLDGVGHNDLHEYGLLEASLAFIASLEGPIGAAGTPDSGPAKP